jgi:hypothetical protein
MLWILVLFVGQVWAQTDVHDAAAAADPREAVLPKIREAASQCQIQVRITTLCCSPNPARECGLSLESQVAAELLRRKVRGAGVTKNLGVLKSGQETDGLESNIRAAQTGMDNACDTHKEQCRSSCSGSLETLKKECPTCDYNDFLSLLSSRSACELKPQENQHQVDWRPPPDPYKEVKREPRPREEDPVPRARREEPPSPNPTENSQVLTQRNLPGEYSGGPSNPNFPSLPYSQPNYPSANNYPAAQSPPPVAATAESQKALPKQPAIGTVSHLSPASVQNGKGTAKTYTVQSKSNTRQPSNSENPAAQIPNGPGNSQAPGTWKATAFEAEGEGPEPMADTNIPQRKSSGDGGGYYSQSSNNGGHNLADYLPNGERSVSRRAAGHGAAATSQIQPSGREVWGYMSDRFKSICRSGRLFDCK